MKSRVIYGVTLAAALTVFSVPSWGNAVQTSTSAGVCESTTATCVLNPNGNGRWSPYANASRLNLLVPGTSVTWAWPWDQFTATKDGQPISCTFVNARTQSGRYYQCQPGATITFTKQPIVQTSTNGIDTVTFANVGSLPTSGAAVLSYDPSRPLQKASIRGNYDTGQPTTDARCTLRLLADIGGDVWTVDCVGVVLAPGETLTVGVA